MEIKEHEYINIKREEPAIINARNINENLMKSSDLEPCISKIIQSADMSLISAS